MSAKKTTVVIRTTGQQRDLIDQAAKLTYKTRNSFILDAATAEAENTILDQRIFYPPPQKYKQFLDTLDQPSIDNPGLRKLLSKKPGWHT